MYRSIDLKIRRSTYPLVLTSTDLNGSSNLEKVLNISSRLEKSLNSYKVLEK